MKKSLLILILVAFSSCYFGMNEDSGRIARDFYLISWDQKYWQISKRNNTSEFNTENIIIRHDVFGVGHNKDFIIAVQHPCDDHEPHLTDDYNNAEVNKEITHYYIIELLKDGEYHINKFNSQEEYLQGRLDLQVPKDVKYQFYKQSLE